MELFERARAAGASGRDSGAVQHPYDPELLDLHDEAVALYANLDGFAFDPEPAGVLVLGRDAAALAALADDLGEAFPELEPTVVDGRAAEPVLAPDVAACRLRSGHPVRPDAATLVFGGGGAGGGAVLHTGVPARAADLLETAGAVLVAAGPWTPRGVDPTGSRRPITRRSGGVNVEVALEEAPRAILEEGGVESAVAATCRRCC